MLQEILKGAVGILVLMGAWFLVQAFLRRRNSLPEGQDVLGQIAGLRELRRTRQLSTKGVTLMPVTLPGPGKAIVHLSEYDIGDPCTAKLLKSERITPKTEAEVRHLVLELPEGDFEFVEGQSIGVLVPGPHRIWQQVSLPAVLDCEFAEG